MKKIEKLFLLILKHRDQLITVIEKFILMNFVIEIKEFVFGLVVIVIMVNKSESDF
jgi:hypothetical protein